MDHSTGTLISYYFYCKRRLWLHANDIRFESDSEDVAMGLFIEDSTYLQRNTNYKQIELDGIKIDFYDYKNKIIHEIKKSNKFEETHIWQLKYYIYILYKNGIDNVKGFLEYPSERKTHEVQLEDGDIERIQKIDKEILDIIQSEQSPSLLNTSKCKNCSYFEFCFSGEEDI